MIRVNHLKFAIILIAACAGISGAAAQNDAKKRPFLNLSGPAPVCPDATNLKAEQLHGRWLVRFDPVPAGLPATAVLELVRHPEFSESLSGRVIRILPSGNGAAAPLTPLAPQPAATAALAGDLEKGGLLLLDESSDNIRITGTWTAELVAQSCGRVFKGIWRDTSSDIADLTPEIAVVISRPIAGSADAVPKSGMAKPMPKP